MMASMAPATVSVRPSRSRDKVSLLFDAQILAKRFKEIISSCKTISDTIVFKVSSSDAESNRITYWAVEEGRVSAVQGRVNDSLFLACGGDDESHIFQASCKVLLSCLSAFEVGKKESIRLKLTLEDEVFSLTLSQGRDKDSAPDVRTINVLASVIEPVGPELASPAYATVDLKRLNKVLAGIKNSTDVVTVSISDNLFQVAASTKRVKDAWNHPSSTRGEASGLFSAAALRNVVAGANVISRFGEVYLSPDQPLSIQAPDEDVVATFFIAGRVAMS